MSKAIYYPSKTFDDQYAAFTQMAAEASWTFPNVDSEQLQRDVEEQRAEREKLDLMQAGVRKATVEFAKRQEERYQRFSDALHAARGAFRSNVAVRKQLDTFRRKARGRPIKKEE